jgi:hypothetical protein
MPTTDKPSRNVRPGKTDLPCGLCGKAGETYVLAVLESRKLDDGSVVEQQFCRDCVWQLVNLPSETRSLPDLERIQARHRALLLGEGPRFNADGDVIKT